MDLGVVCVCVHCIMYVWVHNNNKELLHGLSVFGKTVLPEPQISSELVAK